MARVLILAAYLVLAMTMSAAVGASGADLADFDRKIVREPQYQGQPHYALFVFGPEGNHRSWLVIDGESVAYIDRNGNGDVTEPEERVECDVEASRRLKFAGSGAYLRMNHFPLGDIAGTKLDFRLWIRNPDFDASQDDFYRDHFRKWDEKKWVNGTLIRTVGDGSQSRNPLLLTVRPNGAQISRFGGPITVDLKWGERQLLEPWPKQTVFDIHLGYRNRLAKDCDHHSFGMTRLTTSEVPEFVQPVARFEFPDVTASGKSHIQEVLLDQRCCGDTFYATLTLPQKAQSRHAKVTVQAPEWKGVKAEQSVFTTPINEKIARHSEAAYVMFRQQGIELKYAVNALRKRGLDVFIKPGVLYVHENGNPTYAIQLVQNDEVQRVSESLGEMTDHAAQLSQCHSRFEVSMTDAERTLQDQSVLMEIQAALQELTDGYVYRTWDKQLIAPR